MSLISGAFIRFYSRGYISGAYNGYVQMSLMDSSCLRKSKSLLIITCIRGVTYINWRG